MNANPSKLGLVLVVAVLLDAGAAAAKTGPFEIALRYVPQESVGDSVATLSPGVLERPVRLTVADARPGTDPALIGESTDDDDRSWPVRATNDVAAWAGEVLRKNAADWGVRTADDAPLTLETRLVRFHLTESNKAVGSTYHAEVHVAGTLKDSRGQALWEGTVAGDATRYGRKRSADNANEVLSDALKEVFAALLSGPARQQAWEGKGGPARPASASSGSSGAPAAAGIAPADLLAELVKLRKQGFTTGLLVDYVDRQTLSSALTADDLVQWKKQGMPEEVIKAALARSPGA